MINKKAASYMQIGMMVLGVVSFAYLMGGMVSASNLDSPLNSLFQESFLKDLQGKPEAINLEIESLRKSNSGGMYDIAILELEKLKSLEAIEGTKSQEEIIRETERLRKACLLPSSQISLSNLQTKPISKIQIGEEVLSYDFETGKLTKEIVRDVIISQKSEYLIINGILEITSNHEVLLNNIWQPIGNVVVGDYLFGVNKEKIIINSIEKKSLEKPIDVYDLDLGGKWYFAEGILVHNSASATHAPVATQRVIPRATAGDSFKLKESFSATYYHSDGTKKDFSFTSFSKGADGKYYAMNGDQKVDVTNLVTKGGQLNSDLLDLPVNPSDKMAFGGKYDIGLLKYGNAGYLVEGLTWSLGIAVFIKAVGGIFPSANQDNVNAMAIAGAAGMMSFKTMQQVWGKGGWVNGDQSPTSWVGKTLSNQWVQAGVGLAVAWMVYNSMYEKTKTRTEVVTFSCLPWQAPHGGKDCELCNDGLLPCSEYRCKALGQSCSIINAGTSFERCVNTNPRDVSPPVIRPWDEKLTEGYTYFDVKEMPPGAGFKIKSTASTSGCIEPFTPITFGITTDEPAQCKIDVEPKGNYSKMTAYFGGDNLYSYNHTETLSLPSVENIKNSSLTLQNGKELSFFMRCRDASGNTNEADYELKVCVDPSPDSTAPVILGTSIQTGGCVAAESENSTVDFYLNEPSECRWSFTDSSFDQMKNNMSCSSYATQMNALTVFTCNSLLTGIARDGTNFFVRCKDKPTGVNESKRNVNQESYPFALRGSGQLKLKVIKPNETIYGVLNPTAVELYAETLFGCDDNKAICYYSTSDSESSYTQFFDTNNEDGVSTQRLDLTSGTYTYFIKCVDAGGNLVKNSTSFKVNIDSNAPIIARAYEEDDYLKIVTPINSKCVYTNENCDYLFQEGTVMPYEDSTVHVTEWSPIKKYYIKCIDEFRSEPADCSLIVGPTDNFL